MVRRATASPACSRSGSPHREENPNGASMLVLVDGLEAGDLQSFARCADLFDGNDAQPLSRRRAGVGGGRARQGTN